MMSYALGDLADRLNARLIGDPDHLITGIAVLGEATASEASYLTVHPFGGSLKSYESAAEASQAGVIVMDAKRDPLPNKQLLLAEDPSRAFQELIELFCHPIATGFEDIHPTAVIHATAKLAEGVTVGPHAVIDRGAIIGEGSQIKAQVFVGAQTTIGKGCTLHPRVTLREGCVLGDRVILQPGVVIGADGFGYTTDKTGKHSQLKQLGKVVLEDDVEIGANTTIDRARFTTTRVRRGTKIDNLVMIGHGVEIGEDNLVVAQTGIAGSTRTGKRVVLGGQVGIAGHIEIHDDVIIAARSGVIGTLKEPGQYYGEPARPKTEARRYWMRLLALGKLFDKVKVLESKVNELESNR